MDLFLAAIDTRLKRATAISLCFLSVWARNKALERYSGLLAERVCPPPLRIESMYARAELYCSESATMS